MYASTNFYIREPCLNPVLTLVSFCWLFKSCICPCLPPCVPNKSPSLAFVEAHGWRLRYWLVEDSFGVTSCVENLFVDRDTLVGS